MRTKTITLKDGRTARFMTKNDIAYLRQLEMDHESWRVRDWMLHTEYPMITGRIGFSGTKNHKITTTIVNINGELVLKNAWSICGSQRFGSGMAIHENPATVDCKKCGA